MLFICINVMGGTDMGITYDDLKDLANTIDFSVIESRNFLSAKDFRKSADADPEQEYIEVSREGIAEKIPVETICNRIFVSLSST